MLRLFGLGVAVLLSACSGAPIDRYAANTPVFEATEFFNGRLVAHGMLKNFQGEVTRRFVAEIDASWDEAGVGTLDERFEFDDGELQKRVWTLTPDGQGAYIGTAGDVVGPAQLRFSGNALFLEYVLRIPFNEGTLDLTVDDRMYLIDDHILLNESVLKKFGVKVGELVLVIRKEP